MGDYDASGPIALLCLVVGSAVCIGAWFGIGWAGTVLIFWSAALMWANLP